MHQFLVPSAALTGASAEITGPELHHLQVRRVKTGERIALFDGAGQRRLATIISLSSSMAIARLEEYRPEQPTGIALAIGVLKGPGLDLVVDQATQLGVDEILLFTSSHTQSLPSQGRLERLRKLSLEAAKQSQRATVPRILGPVTFEVLLGSGEDRERLLLWEQAPRSIGALPKAATRSRTIQAIVGPEGSFTALEVERAEAAGCELITLGGTVLRSSTAAVAALVACKLRLEAEPLGSLADSPT